MHPYKIVVSGVNLYEGMAGTKRVRSILDPGIRASNLVVTNFRTGTRTKPAIGESVKNAHGIDYIDLYISAKNPLTLFAYFFKALYYLITLRCLGYRVFYNYGYLDVLNFPVIAMAKTLRYKVVFDIVEDNWLTNQNAGILSKLLTNSSLWLSKIMGYIADGGISISSHTFNLSRRIFGDLSPIALLPVSVDVPRLNALKRSSLDQCVRVFWGGAITFSSDYKSTKDGIQELILAFDAACTYSTELHITGRGSQASMQFLSSIVESCKNKNRIHIHGFLSTEQYEILLGNADIAVMNRVDTDFANAGFPYKLAEYCAAGKAIIATRVSDVDRYLTHNDNALLIPPSDHQSLVGALDILFSDSELRHRLGENSRKTAISHFSSESNSAKFLAFLSKELVRSDFQ